MNAVQQLVNEAAERYRHNLREASNERGRLLEDVRSSQHSETWLDETIYKLNQTQSVITYYQNRLDEFEAEMRARTND